MNEHVKQIVNFGAYSLCNLLVWVSEGIPYIRVTDMKEDGILWSNCPRIPLEIHEQLPKSKVHSNDVLYSMAGTIGLAVVAPDELGECNSNQAIAKIRVKDSLSPHYLATFFNSRLGRLQSERIANGQTVLNINMGEIGELDIPLPPRPIQDGIAAVMQDAYAQRREKLAAAEQLINSMDEWGLKFLGLFLSNFVADRMFTANSRNTVIRWDVEYHQPLNPIMLSNDWCNLERYATVVRETFTPSKEAETSYYYVGIDTMNNNPYSTEESADNLLGNEINGLRKCFKGTDVLLARLAPPLSNKKSALAPSDLEMGYCSPEFLVIRPKRNVDPRFILWSVKANFAITQMLLKTTGATPSQMRLQAPELLKIRVPNAPLDQQQKIGQELESRHARATQLRQEAETVVAEAKARVERMILGEETP